MLEAYSSSFVIPSPSAFFDKLILPSEIEIKYFLRGFLLEGNSLLFPPFLPPFSLTFEPFSLPFFLVSLHSVFPNRIHTLKTGQYRGCVDTPFPVTWIPPFSECPAHVDDEHSLELAKQVT